MAAACNFTTARIDLSYQVTLPYTNFGKIGAYVLAEGEHAGGAGSRSQFSWDVIREDADEFSRAFNYGWENENYTRETSRFASRTRLRYTAFCRDSIYVCITESRSGINVFAKQYRAGTIMRDFFQTFPIKIFFSLLFAPIKGSAFGLIEEFAGERTNRPRRAAPRIAWQMGNPVQLSGESLRFTINDRASRLYKFEGSYFDVQARFLRFVTSSFCHPHPTSTRF